MSKLATLSLRLVERLEELGLITEEAEEYAEDVEENLVESLEDFCSAAEDFLANDYGDWREPENADKLGDKISLLLRRVDRLSDGFDFLGDVATHAMNAAKRG